MSTAYEPSQLRSEFQQDGYVVIRSFLNAGEIAELRQELAAFIDTLLPQLPAHLVYREDAGQAETLKQIQQLGEHSEYFGRWQNQSKFREVAEMLLDGPVVPKNIQYFNKPPGVGQPTPPHQDGFYFMLEPCEAVTMWLALEEVDEETGCVRYIPGSHKQGLRAHGRTATLGFSQGIIDYPTSDDVERELALPARPGDLLAHHALTIHRADGNRSQTRTREAMGLIYYSHRAQEDTAAHEAYQRKLAGDLAGVGKI